MIVRANHVGNGEVEVNLLIKRDAEVTDTLVEMVSINQTIIDNLNQVTDDPYLIQTTLLELLSHIEGVLDKC